MSIILFVHLSMSILLHKDLKEAISFSSWIYKLGEDLAEGDPDMNSLSYGIAPKWLGLTFKSEKDSVATTSLCFHLPNIPCCRPDDPEPLSCELEQIHARYPIAFLLNDQRDAGFLIKYVDGTLCEPKTTMQYAIAVNAVTKRIYVVFRGTDELRDWASNLNSHSQELLKDVLVHRGFYKLLSAYLEDLYASIDALLGQAKYATYAVHVYGHSLGGALSSLFGYLLAVRFKERNQSTKVHVITVAAPAVGNSAFRTQCEGLLNLSTVRLVYNKDFAPSCHFNDNHCHVGSTLVHLRRGRARVYRNYSYPECLDSVTNCNSVTDHSLTSYWRAIHQAQVESDLIREGVVGDSV